MEDVNQAKDKEKELFELNINLQSSAKWFYWIAGLSVVNTVINFFGGGMSFLVGLGMTQLIDGFVFEASSTVKLVALFMDLIISSVFAIFGYFALKLEKWAFFVGMTLYFIDGLIFLMVQDWLSIGFHAFILFALFAGIKSIYKIESLQKQEDGGIAELEKQISNI